MLLGRLDKTPFLCSMPRVLLELVWGEPQNLLLMSSAPVMWMLLALGPHFGYQGVRALGSIWLSRAPGVGHEGAVSDRGRDRKRLTNSNHLTYCPAFAGLGAVTIYVTKLNIHINYFYYRKSVQI